MKKLVSFAAFILFVVACTSTESNNVQDFISGTYVKTYLDSISPTAKVEGTDVLEIKKQVKTGSETYQVTRTNKFKRTMDNQAQPEETKTEKWSGVYDSENKILTTDRGKTISFDLDKKRVIVGTIEYDKIQ